MATEVPLLSWKHRCPLRPPSCRLTSQPHPYSHYPPVVARAAFDEASPPLFHLLTPPHSVGALVTRSGFLCGAVVHCFSECPFFVLFPALSALSLSLFPPPSDTFISVRGPSCVRNTARELPPDAPLLSDPIVTSFLIPFCFGRSPSILPLAVPPPVYALSVENVSPRLMPPPNGSMLRACTSGKARYACVPRLRISPSLSPHMQLPHLQGE